MNLLKIILSAVAVLLISISVPTLRTPAAAENKPLDVHLTIETKEIDISEIPDDRIVYLGISIDNAPPFKGLTMYLDKDPRLKFGEPKPFKPAEGVQNIGSINVISYLEIAPDVLGCGVPAKGSKMIDHSGVLIMTELVLPEEVRAGDFYYLKFSPYLGSSHMVIDLSIFPEDRYGLDSFTQLNNGGIRITEKAQSQPPKPPASSTSSTTSSAPVSTASSSTTTSSTTSSTPASTASSSTTKSSSATSSTPASTASSSTTKSSSATSSTPASTASSSTATTSLTVSPTPASTVSSSTAAASSTTSSVPASTTSSSTTASSSTSSPAPASIASSSTSTLTAAASSASSTSPSVPATSDNSEDEPENKNKFPIIAVLIALGVIALSLTAVFIVAKKRKK